MNRRDAIAALSTASTALPALAQPKPIRLIVPCPPGGPQTRNYVVLE